MDYLKIINDIQKNNPKYQVLIGTKGYQTHKETDLFFKRYFYKEYLKRITVLIMLISSWYETYVFYEESNDQDKKKFPAYDKQVFRLHTRKEIRNLPTLIEEAMKDNESRLRLMLEAEKEELNFVMEIQSEAEINFYGLSENLQDYIGKQVNRQGLSLYRVNNDGSLRH